MVNARPIIDRVTRPLLPSVVPNDESSRVCAADGWIDEGMGAAHFRTCLAKSSVLFTRSPIIDRFIRSLIRFGLDFAALPFRP